MKKVGRGITPVTIGNFDAVFDPWGGNPDSDNDVFGYIAIEYVGQIACLVRNTYVFATPAEAQARSALSDRIYEIRTKELAKMHGYYRLSFSNKYPNAQILYLSPGTYLDVWYHRDQ